MRKLPAHLTLSAHVNAHCLCGANHSAFGTTPDEAIENIRLSGWRIEERPRKVISCRACEEKRRKRSEAAHWGRSPFNPKNRKAKRASPVPDNVIAVDFRRKRVAQR